MSLQAICYIIELKTPVLATDVQNEPNGSISASFIPGSLLRGALVGCYLAEKKLQGPEKEPPEFDALTDALGRKLFLSDQTRFLPAYPVNADEEDNKKRALPTPVAWRNNKNERVEDGKAPNIYDLSRQSSDKRDKGLAQEFCWYTSGNARLFSPARQLNVHTQRDARKGRPVVIPKNSEKDGEPQTLGTIYRYDALAAGLRLKAVILTTAELAPTLTQLLSGGRTLWIGRARRAGYGRAEVVAVEPLTDPWRETDAGDAPPLSNDGKLRITLASDALLRDENGQATLDPRAAIADALKVDRDALRPQPQFTWAKTKVVGGFNRKWGMPLPQSVALAAGSVFVYQTDIAISVDHLKQLEERGIGERRNEGFGRLLVNWPADESSSFASLEIDPGVTAPTVKARNAEEQKLAEAIARRLLRRELHQALIKKINETKIESAPKKSQLARLRVILRTIQAGRNPGQAQTARLTEYLDQLPNRRTARTQFESAKVIDDTAADAKPLPLIDWIKNQLADPARSWPQKVTLGEDSAAPLTVKTDAHLAQHYTLRLLDQVLYRATKEPSDERRSSGKTA